MYQSVLRKKTQAAWSGFGEEKIYYLYALE